MGELEALLPDDLILQVLSFISYPRELSRAELTSQRFRQLQTDLLWRNACFRTWPPHYCEDKCDNKTQVASQEEGGTGGAGTGTGTCSHNTRNAHQFWKRRYRFIQQDLQRTELTPSELEGLEWNFSFVKDTTTNNNNNSHLNRISTLRSSDRGSEILSQQRESSACYFIDGRLYIIEYLWRFALLEIELLEYEDGGENENDEAQVVSNLLWENRQFPYLTKALSSASSADGGIACNLLGDGREDDDDRLSQSLRFSYRQSLRIADFALHSVARTASGGWIIWNKHVVLTSTGKRRKNGPLPGVLQEHLALLRRFDW